MPKLPYPTEYPNPDRPRDWTGIASVRLSFDDQVLARITAKQRYRNARAAGQDQSTMTSEPSDAELIGVIGEIALARLGGDFEFRPAVHFVAGAADYRGVEVRATRLKWGGLIFRAGIQVGDKWFCGDEEKADRSFVLAVVPASDYPAVYFPGWKIGDDIRKSKHTLREMPPKPRCWILDQDQLNTMATLEILE